MPRRDTRPELLLRRELHRRGLRFVLQGALPGRPDIVFTRARLAVFIDGCYWHRCPEHSTIPKNNRDWWQAKLQANVDRDARQSLQLETAGWTVLRIWEHEPVHEAATRVEALYRSNVDGLSDGPPRTCR